MHCTYDIIISRSARRAVTADTHAIHALTAARPPGSLLACGDHAAIVLVVFITAGIVSWSRIQQYETPIDRSLRKEIFVLTPVIKLNLHANLPVLSSFHLRCQDLISYICSNRVHTTKWNYSWCCHISNRYTSSNSSGFHICHLISPNTRVPWDIH